jgi:hypothetical protein
MAWDGVELIHRVEDEFEIAIDDDEALRLATVGDLYRLVLSKAGTNPACLTSRAFYRTRQALAEALGVPRRGIRESTELGTLLPHSRRSEPWKRIAAEIGLKFPRLRHPRQWNDLFLLCSMLLAALPVAALWWALYAIDWIGGIGVFLFSIPALILWVLLVSRLVLRLERATPHMASELPFATVGELAIGVLALNDDVFEPMKKENQPVSKDAAWKRLVAVFSEQLKVDPDRVVENAAIAEDLGTR